MGYGRQCVHDIFGAFNARGYLLLNQRRILPLLIMPAAARLVLLLLFNGHMQAQDPCEGLLHELGGRYFTVRDSIEMARFERTGGEPKFSPDRKYFTMVTSRGILRSNEIESTLWVVQSEVVKKLLRTDEPPKGFGPKIVAR